MSTNIPTGYSLVPLSPTARMIDNIQFARGQSRNSADVWRAAISELPTPPVDAVPGEPAEFERVARLLDAKGGPENQYAAKIIRTQAAWADRITGERNAMASALQTLVQMLEAWHAEFPNDVGHKELPALESAHAALAAPRAPQAVPGEPVARDFETWWEQWPFGQHKNPLTKACAHHGWRAGNRAKVTVCTHCDGSGDDCDGDGEGGGGPWCEHCNGTGAAPAESRAGSEPVAHEWTDADAEAWGTRHDVRLTGGDLFCAFEDAASLHRLWPVHPMQISDERIRDAFMRTNTRSYDATYACFRDGVRFAEKALATSTPAAPTKVADQIAPAALLQAQVDVLTAELHEEARINGMGGEREAALLARVKVLTQERDVARQPVGHEARRRGYQEGHRDGMEQAAEVCDNVNNFDNPMTSGDCAALIRALSVKPAQENI